MSAQHTSPPYTVDDSPRRTRIRIVNVAGTPVATIDSASANTREAKETAAFIVKACNAYEGLLAAFDDLEHLFDGQEDCDDGSPNDAMKAMVIIRAARAKAGVA